ncbi:MAG: hypothetical protein FJ125_17090 [Deltaproteobacteria bacterium]|nr:hypothetical protein [Deltaproteobacteria bacterium]
MARKVPQRKGRHKSRKADRLSAAERRERLLARQALWVARWVVLAKTLIESILGQEVDQILGRPKGKWGDRSDTSASAEVNAVCYGCKRRFRGWFSRNGTYPRTLACDGVVVELMVPRLRCACGQSVDMSFSVFAPYERISPELAARLREGIALGLGLTEVAEMMAPMNGGPLAKSTISAHVMKAEQLVEGLRTAKLKKVPPIVLLDGIWLTQMEPTGKRFTDAKGRDRPEMRRLKVGLLVAYGVDPQEGQWRVLDWERAEQEDEASWGRLLERLRERGLTGPNGLKLIVSDGSDGLAAALKLVDLGTGVKHQRCVFHKLRNVWKAVKGLLAGEQEKDEKKAREARRQRRLEVVRAAAAIYRGGDRAEVLRRRDEFVAKWQETEPEAVATLLRDFEQTIVYLEVAEEAAKRGEKWEHRYLRTTSALERRNRTIRKAIRQAVLSHSARGLDVRIYLALFRAGVLLSHKGDDWLDTLEKELAAA